MAAELKHTKGPWRVEAGGIVVGPDEGFVPFGGCGCCGSPWLNGTTEEEEVANAHLIAAAPDLLQALQNCEARLALLVESGRSKSLDAVAAENARAVIKKAIVST